MIKRLPSLATICRPSLNAALLKRLIRNQILDLLKAMLKINMNRC